MKHCDGLGKLALILMMVALTGCASPLEPAAQRATRADNLAEAIMLLSPAINRQEAHGFALAAVETSAELGKKYQVALSPWLHNASIVVGLKERGFCYQYAEDLYASLKFINHDDLDIHYVAANMGKINEHHALAVVAKNAPWDSGLLLDAWRRNGTLYFVALKKDSYPWVHDADASLVVPEAAH